MLCGSTKGSPKWKDALMARVLGLAAHLEHGQKLHWPALICPYGPKYLALN